MLVGAAAVGVDRVAGGVAQIGSGAAGLALADRDVAGRIDQGRRVGLGVQVAVQAERVLGGAGIRVEGGEGADRRGVEAGARVVQRPCRGGRSADVEAALVAEVGGDRGAAPGAARQVLAEGVVAERGGDRRLGRGEGRGGADVLVPSAGRGIIRPCPPVAQWIRATDFGSVGRGFESLRAGHLLLHRGHR